uniref:Long wavelength sensitive opsin 2 n=1 Tax=Acmaeodera diffusa TaxID=1853719 RepID=A0A193BIT8_9COLE|nr:long wavelength sensitive opsin 2 [Acmaeodera diffusa]ANN11812.1 long wavelength sensitive opsin 2 [Acmaeodera diffusa]APY20542.1 long wavelength sensitive opsin 2 [Acmaeodera diffusa]
MSVLGEPKFAAWTAQRITASAFSGNMTVVDKVPPEMLHLIAPHWYQHPPLNPMWHGIIGFLMGVMGVIAFFGNGMVVYIFCSTKTLRTPSNFLVVNLAFSDFLMMVSLVPEVVINCYFETWALGPLLCEIHGMLGSLLGCTSIWTMSAIAVDRYNVIVKGLSAKPLTVKGVLLRLLIIWLFCALWAIAPMLGWNRYVPEGNMTACGTDYFSTDWLSMSYIYAYSFFVYFLPLGLIIYSYWFIVQAVAAHEKSMREQAKKMNVATLRSGDAAKTSAECKLAKVALMTISLWFIAWTPYLVVNWLGLLHPSVITPLVSILCSIFAKMNAMYNPIVYAISHPKYKQALYKKFPSLACGGSGDDTTSTATNATTEETKSNA